MSVTKLPKKKATPKVPKSSHYINNAELLLELEKSHAQDRMTERFGEMIILLCQRYITIPRFAKYTYTDDMQRICYPNSL